MTIEDKSTNEAVQSMMLASGHVVALSGMTLFLTFVILILFPQDFLQSVGWGCGVTVFSAVIIMTYCILHKTTMPTQ
jgi:uncharacterized membrane protein YdfJ with MMPL/SSD domain